MFWHGGPLSQLETLCMASFVAQGYNLTLWTYSAIPNVPTGVKLADADQILPKSALFLNRHGSYASFSDWFRYAVLSRIGGLYADTDVVALLPARDLPRKKFLVTQWEWSKRRLRPRCWNIKINNNVIYNPDPANGDVIDLASVYAEHFPKTAIDWSEIGPSLLNAIIGIHPAHGFTIMPTDFANPLGYWKCPAALLKPGRIPAGVGFLHCYNEMWRRADIDKNAPFPHGSIMARLATRFASNTAI